MPFTAQRLQGAYAEAIEPSILTSMSRSDLERIMQEKAEVGIRLVNLLSERLRSCCAPMSPAWKI